jgi:hypothetical protein
VTVVDPGRREGERAQLGDFLRAQGAADDLDVEQG